MCVCGGKAFLEQSAFLYIALCWVGRSALSILTKATEILGPQKPAFTHFMEKETFPSIFFRSVIKYKKNYITIPCQFEKEMPLEKNNVLYFCICEFFSSFFFLLFSSSSSLLVGSSLLCATLKLALANAVLYFH